MNRKTKLLAMRRPSAKVAPSPHVSLPVVADATSRERLLDVAEALMSKQGYAGTSVSEIVESAGVRAPALYWHFKSKQGILAAVMERGADAWYSQLPRLTDVPGETAAQRISAAMLGAGRAIEAKPQFLRLLILLTFERSEADEAIWASIKAIRVKARVWLHSLFNDAWPRLTDVDCETLATRSMTFADGWMVLQMIEPERLEAVSFGWLAQMLAQEAERLQK